MRYVSESFNDIEEKVRFVPTTPTDQAACGIDCFGKTMTPEVRLRRGDLRRGSLRPAGGG